MRGWTVRTVKYACAAGLLGFYLAGLLVGLSHPDRGSGGCSQGSTAQVELGTPLEVVKEFFSILAGTGYTVHFGSIGSRGDYLAAYELLSRRYREEAAFDRFHESFRGVAGVEVSRLVPLPGGGDRRQVFVELRTVEEVGPGGLSPDPVRSAFLFYSGLVTVVREGGVWRIDRMELRAEDFISPRGGHQPWRRDPQAVAVVAAHEELEEIGIEDPWTYPCSVGELDNGLVEVIFATGEGRVVVLLVRLATGDWLALRVLLLVQP